MILGDAGSESGDPHYGWLNNLPLVEGNVDLNHRPVVRNPDGSISTVRSITVGTDSGYALLPTVSPDGRIWSNPEAIRAFQMSGQHLGLFRNEAAANAYAQHLHENQARQYLPAPAPPPRQVALQQAIAPAAAMVQQLAQQRHDATKYGV